MPDSLSIVDSKPLPGLSVVSSQPLEQPGFLRGLWDTVNPLPTLQHYSQLAGEEQQQIQDALKKGDYKTAAKAFAKSLPGVDLATDIGKAQAAQFHQAYQDFTNTKEMPDLNSRLLSASGHVAAGSLPIVGPAAAAAGENIGTPGKTAYGLGQAAGLLLPFGREAIPARLPLVPRMATSLDPAEAAAVDFAKQNAIPLDAATATGNPAVRNVQNLAQNMPGVAARARRNMLAQKNAMTTVGGNLAEAATGVPNAGTAEGAGLGVQSELSQSIAQKVSDARAAYGHLESLENDPANLQTIHTSTTQVPVRSPSGSVIGMQPSAQSLKVALPVDMRSVKTALQPVLDDLKQQMPVAQQRASYGLKAIENIVNGPDYMPASIADQNLSAVKAIQRESASPKAVYLAAKAVDQFSPAVDAAVAKAGPTATQALQDGRELWKAKIANEETLSALPDEPVQLFNKLTSAKDANINTLQDVAAKAPNALPAIGRSYLDGLMQKAFAEAGTDKPGTVLTQWQTLGPRTKELLFPDAGLRSDLDNFFTLAKKRAENPNPSGTAYLGMLTSDGVALMAGPHLAVPYLIGRTALGRILTSPYGAKLLSEGLSMPFGNTAKAAIVSSRILSLAGTDAKPVSGAGNSPYIRIGRPAAVAGP